jgi:hypothetical protein
MIRIRRSDFHTQFGDRISVRKLIGNGVPIRATSNYPPPLLALHISASMPPKKTSLPPLTDAEVLLMKIAARVFTAIKYKEAHPNEDHSNFQRNMTMEMVSDRFRERNCFNCCFLF